MFLVYPILLILLFVPLKEKSTKSSKGGEDYLSPQRTMAFKGLFTILVMCSHFKTYVVLPNTWLNQLFTIANENIGQLMVAMFFFYSGFGIFSSITLKPHYIDTFIRKRLLPVWTSFAISILIYIAYHIIAGRLSTYSIRTILFSFTGWTSIGNSNWFMFDTFVVYILLVMIWKVPIPDNAKLFVFSGCCFFLVIILYFTKRSDWWWDTLMCFPAGMVYAKYKGNIDRLINNYSVFPLLLLSSVCFFLSRWLQNDIHPIFSIASSILFSLVIVFISMLVCCKGMILYWVGKHVFSIYILQRLWYMVFQNSISNPYMYFLTSVIFTVISAAVFDYCMRTFVFQLIEKSQSKESKGNRLR